MAVNLSFIGGAGWQFFDDNGVPLAGGKIYTYAAATTTPLATYTTRTGAVANANPIILDAAGRTPEQIWSTEGLLYKYVVADANDVVIRTWDNIGGSVVASDLAQNLASTSNNSLGDALIGFKQSNSSGFIADAVARTVNAKLQEIVSVKDFGALGDGVTNDVSAFQKTIDATLNAGVQTALVPTGTYVGDMTTLNYGAREGFVWQEQGVTYLTAAPKSTVAQGVGLVVTRTNAKVTGSARPTFVGQVGFEYSSLGLSGESPAVVIDKKSDYTSGTAANPSALSVTTTITTDTDTKDNAIISVINDDGVGGSANSRTAIMSVGRKRAQNDNNIITANFVVEDLTLQPTSVTGGSCVAAEIGVQASGLDDAGLGRRFGIDLICLPEDAYTANDSEFTAGIRVRNTSNTAYKSTWTNAYLVQPNDAKGGITNAFAVQEGTVTNVLRTRGLTNKVTFDLGCDVTSGTIYTKQLAARNSSNALTPFARMDASIVSGTAGAENGSWSFQTVQSGVMTAAMAVANGVVIGVPTGTYKGNGTLNVAGDIYKNNTAYTNPDYVFEKYYDGQIVKFIDNPGAKTYQGKKSIDEIEQIAKETFRLPGFTDAPTGAFERFDMLLEKLEEAYLCIFELNARLKKLEGK